MARLAEWTRTAMILEGSRNGARGSSISIRSRLSGFIATYLSTFTQTECSRGLSQ
jgi:hypothetical protein